RFDWMGSQWPSMGVRSRPRVISVEQFVFMAGCKDPNWVLSGIAYTNYPRIGAWKHPLRAIADERCGGSTLSKPGRWKQQARER
ncbi:MAG: hypothetical protein MJH08_10885, partial [Hyphomicrobiales bacterium]|nr:hypothetical protein [Hyphomicrobiales bacterium]